MEIKAAKYTPGVVNDVALVELADCKRYFQGIDDLDSINKEEFYSTLFKSIVCMRDSMFHKAVLLSGIDAEQEELNSSETIINESGISLNTSEGKQLIKIPWYIDSTISGACMAYYNFVSCASEIDERINEDTDAELLTATQLVRILDSFINVSKFVYNDYSDYIFGIDEYNTLYYANFQEAFDPNNRRNTSADGPEL